MIRKSVLVLGGAGFIGSNISRFFFKKRYQVTVIDGLLDQTGGKVGNLSEILPQINFFKKKVEDVFKLPDLIKKSDIIIDCLAWTSHRLALDDPRYDLALNVNSHLSYIPLLKNQTEKLVIFLGSRGQYGNPRLDKITEGTSMVPEDIQGTHKLTAESYFRIYSKLYNFSAVSLRIPNCFGPNQQIIGEDIGLIGMFIRDNLQGKELIVYGKGRKRSLVYVLDLVDIIYRICQKSNNGFEAYNIAGQDIAIDVLAALIIKIAGNGKLLILPLSEEIKKIDIGNAIVSEKKLIRKLGSLKQTDLKLALSQTIEYFRQEI